MTKYLVNESMHGYECIDASKDVEKDNLVIVVVNKDCNAELNKYYRLINNALKNRNQVILISVDDDNRLLKPLASLMLTYNQYGIYQIVDKDSITAEYLLKLENRKPDLSEVQTYIGGDVTAYSDINTLLFGIESLVDEGNEQGLRNFIEENMESISNMTTAINDMKKTCDMFNSNELVEAVAYLKEEEGKLKNEITEKDEVVKQVKYERDQKTIEVNDLRRENDKLKAKNSDLKDQGSSNGMVIRTYPEVNTQLIKCKTKVIIYFKEISYVNFTNTLITHLQKHLTRKLNLKKSDSECRLLIYDTDSEMYGVYKPLNIINGANYGALKDSLIKNSTRFVVSEPNPTIINNILESEYNNDILIIYDRMHHMNDIVAGNNVTKFYIVNSNNDYKNLKQSLKITDTSYIITNANSSIEADNKNRQFLDIPEIPGYKSSTDSAKESKYTKLVTEFSKVPLLETIIKKSRANTLF